jgi:hypothetical protein
LISFTGEPSSAAVQRFFSRRPALFRITEFAAERILPVDL